MWSGGDTNGSCSFRDMIFSLVVTSNIWLQIRWKHFFSPCTATLCITESACLQLTGKQYTFTIFPHKYNMYLTWCHNLVWRNSNDLTIPRAFYASTVNWWHNNWTWWAGSSIFIYVLCMLLGGEVRQHFSYQALSWRKWPALLWYVCFSISVGREVLMDYVSGERQSTGTAFAITDYGWSNVYLWPLF